METATVDLKQVVSDWPDAVVHDAFFLNMRTVRDRDGNLRDLTDGEEEFIAIVRAEWRARGNH